MAKVAILQGTGSPQGSGFASTSRHNSGLFGAALKGIWRGVWFNVNFLNLPVAYSLFAVTVPAAYSLIVGNVPTAYSLFADTLLAYNLFLKIKEINLNYKNLEVNLKIK